LKNHYAQQKSKLTEITNNIWESPEWYNGWHDPRCV
jgi:hypothetical protein